MATKEALLELLDAAGYPEAKGSDSLVEDLGMDSLDVASFAQEIEDVLQVELDDHDIDDTTTVDDLVRVIDEKAA